jgi:hypothetical protein
VQIAMLAVRDATADGGTTRVNGRGGLMSYGTNFMETYRQTGITKIFSTLQLEAPALLTLCPAQQTECHHVQHPHPPVLEAHRVIH